MFFFFIFLSEGSRFTGQQGKEKTDYLIPLYHVHPCHDQDSSFTNSCTELLIPLVFPS